MTAKSDHTPKQVVIILTYETICDQIYYQSTKKSLSLKKLAKVFGFLTNFVGSYRKASGELKISKGLLVARDPNPFPRQNKLLLHTDSDFQISNIKS